MRSIIKPLLTIVLVSLLTTLLHSCEDEPHNAGTVEGKKTTYTCPMHPQVVSDKPGTCPICAMDLVPFDKTNKSEELTLSKTQQALANITTDTVGEGTIATIKRLNARIVVDPQQSTYISTRVPGRLENVFVKQTGVPVNKGQALYTVYSEQLAALQQEYLVMAAQAREFPLNQRFQQIASAAAQKLKLYGQTDAQLKALIQKKKADPYVTFFAPASGVVAELLVSEGQYVAEGTAVMSLENYNSVWVEADVYPAELNLVKQGQQVRVLVQGFEDEPLQMKLEFTAPALANNTQLTTVRGTVANPGQKFKSGMQAIVELPVSGSEAGIIVPAEAVLHNGNTSHVWIQAGADKFKPRVVQTGVQTMNTVEITSGLQQGDIVVVSGAYLLYSEYVLKKGKNPVAHNH